MSYFIFPAGGWVSSGCTLADKFKFNHYLCFFLAEDDQHGGNFLPGEPFVFPFSFRLPADANLPSSYEDSDGQICYLLEATIERPNLKLNKTVKIPVHVIDPVDVSSTELQVR
jgi:hypothetical protein